MRKKLVYGVCLLLALFLLASCTGTTPGTSGGEVVPSTQNATLVPITEPTPEPTLEPINGIDDTVTIGDWEITLLSCEVVEKVASSKYSSFKADDGNKYVLVTLKVKNNGTSADFFLPTYSLGNSIYARLRYKGEYEFSSTNLLGYSEELHDKHLNPLSSAEGNITFEIAEDAADLDEIILVFSEGGKNVEFSLGTTRYANDSDAKDLEYFKRAFEDAGYTLERVDEPVYSMINASKGILFYVGNKVVKIYQYKDEATYEKAKKDNAFMEDWPKNGLFVAESNSDELLEFFKTIK